MSDPDARARAILADMRSAVEQAIRFGDGYIPAGHVAGWANELEGEWQPIETAPKDGTSILCVGPWVHDGGKLYMDIGFWTDYAGGFWDWRWDDSQPTHWRPLPPAPGDPHR